METEGTEGRWVPKPGEVYVWIYPKSSRPSGGDICLVIGVEEEGVDVLWKFSKNHLWKRHTFTLAFFNFPRSSNPCGYVRVEVEK